MRIFGSVQPKSCRTILHTRTLISLCLIMLPSISYQYAQSIYEVCIVKGGHALGPVRHLVCKRHRIYVCLFPKRVRFCSNSLGSACCVQSTLNHTHGIVYEYWEQTSVGFRINDLWSEPGSCYHYLKIFQNAPLAKSNPPPIRWSDHIIEQ